MHARGAAALVALAAAAAALGLSALVAGAPDDGGAPAPPATAAPPSAPAAGTAAALPAPGTPAGDTAAPGSAAAPTAAGTDTAGARPGGAPAAAPTPAPPSGPRPDLPAPGLALRAHPLAPTVEVTVAAPLWPALAPPPRADGSDATQVLRVPEEFPTIAAALAAAPEGALVRIAPGVYRERLTIRRSVTLAGARAAAGDAGSAAGDVAAAGAGPGAGADASAAPATVLEGTAGLDRLVLAESAGRGVRLESLLVRGVGAGGVDAPDGVVAHGARLTVSGCAFEGLRVAVTLDGAPLSTVAGNRFAGNAVAVRITGGAPLIALNVVRGPGAFGVQASGTDAAVALNVFTGVAVGAAFAGPGAAPLFAGNTVADATRMGVFFDQGVRGEVRGAAFVRATAAVVVVDATLAGAGHNLFWENRTGEYLRDAERKGALAPLLPPPPAAGDLRADPRLDAATFVPAPGSPLWGAGDAAALGRAGLAELLGAPLAAPPAGALGLPAPAPRPGLGAFAPGRDGDDLRVAAPSDLGLLLSLVRDDCGGAFDAHPARDGSLTLRCVRCGRVVAVRPALLRRP